MSQIKAQLRRVAEEARGIVKVRCAESAQLDAGRVELEVTILGEEEADGIAELAGGRNAPFGLPREGEVWLAAALGADLNDLILLLPIFSGEGDEETFSAGGLDRALWAPSPGRLIRIETRAAGAGETRPAIEASAGSLALSGDEALELVCGGVTLSLDKSGRASLSNGAVELVAAVDSLCGWLLDTLTDLSVAVTVTALGPQPLSTAPIFAARAVEVATLKGALSTLKR